MTVRRVAVLSAAAVAGVGLAFAVAVVAHPRGRATLRLVPGFDPLPEDGRVFAEDRARPQAVVVAAALPSAIADVERIHGAPFRSPFRVYVCSTHERFARQIGHPPDTPVRGIAFLRDVWISPLAFAFLGRDTHREALRHELSHLHLTQTLGWWRRTREVPAWFQEGLADVVGGTGFERTSRTEAVDAMRAGRALAPGLFGGPPDHDLSWAMFHAQSRMFVEHLRALDPAAFERLMQTLTAGARFSDAFEVAFGTSADRAWSEFVTRVAIEGLPTS